MYELLSLKLKCPVCGSSLMDEKKLVDNEASIKLNIEIGGKKGVIHLSSIWGSYNHDTDIEMPDDEIATFSCPHCAAHITSDTGCLSCDAPMVPFYLDMGGKVSICSRNGCKDHKVEFDDLSVAMSKLYQEYGLNSSKMKRTPKVPSEKIEEVKDEVEEILESGTFLQSYCPQCKKSLIENDMLKLKIKNGKVGYLMLSPYLNVFTTKSTIFLPEDKTVKDLCCYHCDESLIHKEEQCGKCESPIARIQVSARTKMVDFFICTKKGCKWHGLDKQDYFDIRLEDSLEW